MFYSKDSVDACDVTESASTFKTATEDVGDAHNAASSKGERKLSSEKQKREDACNSGESEARTPDKPKSASAEASTSRAVKSKSACEEAGVAEKKNSDEMEENIICIICQEILHDCIR